MPTILRRQREKATSRFEKSAQKLAVVMEVRGGAESQAASHDNLLQALGWRRETAFGEQKGLIRAQLRPDCGFDFIGPQPEVLGILWSHDRSRETRR
jgi:hypothetical protein